MRLGVYGTLLMASVATLGVLASKSESSPKPENPGTTVPRRPVLLELFTSEGCSSCPPADRLLERFDRSQPVAGAQIIVLSEHVDYWNTLGWSDPYSAPLFTQRQMAYTDRLGTSSPYTPQLIIDGFMQAVGSDEPAVRAAVLKAERQTKTPVELDARREGINAKLNIKVTAASHDANVYVALADDHAQSEVTRGENAHHTLQHVAVVKTLLPAGKTDRTGAFAKALTLPLKNGTSGLWRVVVFLQDSNSRISGIAEARLS